MLYLFEEDLSAARKIIIRDSKRKTVGKFCSDAVTHFSDKNDFVNVGLPGEFLDYVNEAPSGLDKQLRSGRFTQSGIHSYLCYLFRDFPKNSKQYQEIEISDIAALFELLNLEENYNSEAYLITNRFIRSILNQSKFKNYSISLSQDWKLIYSVKSENQDLTDDIDEGHNFLIESPLFNFVAAIQSFDLAFPISLAVKLTPDFWSDNRIDILSNTSSLGIRSEIDDTGFEVLVLNAQGQKIQDSLAVSDKLVFQILDYCDMSVSGENRLFNELTRKQRHFVSLFQDFQIDFLHLINSGTFPSKDKNELLYRLQGLYYSRKGDQQKMRESFQKCIALLRQTNSYNSSAFYLDWATEEFKHNNPAKAAVILSDALSDLPLPYHKNRAARFGLSIYYTSINEHELAYNLWSEFDFLLFKDEEFSDKLNKHIRDLINLNKSDEATLLQNFFLRMTRWLYTSDRKEISALLIEKLNEAISNNKFLRIHLVKSHIANNLESGLSKIQELEADLSVERSQITVLYMDYYISLKDLDLAIWYGEQFLENKPESRGRAQILRKIARIYSSKSDWRLAKETFEQLPIEALDASFPYAIALYNYDRIRFKSRVIKIFESYFQRNPKSTSTRALGTYVSICLNYKLLKKAGRIVFEKLKNIKASDHYSDYYISNLYQQQLRLTVNPNHGQVLFEKSLASAVHSKQLAIVHSNYAKHLLNPGEDRSILKTSYYTKQAKYHFEKAYELKDNKDDGMLLDIISCDIELENYENAIDLLLKVKDPRFSVKSQTLLINVYGITENYFSIKKLIPRIEFDENLGLSFYWLTNQKKIPHRKRLEYFEQAMFYSYDTDIIVKYAAYLFKLGKIEQSNKYLDQVKTIWKDNKFKRIQIQDNFTRIVQKYSKKPPQKSIISKIVMLLKDHEKPNPKLLARINGLIRKYPLDNKIYGFKFDYFFKLRNFYQCQRILDFLASEDRIDNATAENFYKLAEDYYKFAGYYGYRRPELRDSKVKKLIQAFYYLDKVVRKYKKTKYLVLYALVAFRQGDLKKYNTLIKSFKQDLSQDQFASILSILKKRTVEINHFYWPSRPNDYYDKLHFYKHQEQIGATLIGNSSLNKKAYALTIFKSIISDTEFHRWNKHYILNRLTTRLAHYYYFIERDYDSALFYQRKVYKAKYNDPPFIRAFLLTLEKLINNDTIDFGIEVCEYYLDHVKLPSIYRHYGNFLKYKGYYFRSLGAYLSGLEITKQPHFIALLNNNIILLIHDSAYKKKDIFLELDELKRVAETSFSQIIDLYPDYEHKSNALKMLKDIQGI